MRAAPEPKAARLTGAYTLCRRGPNWLRSVAVSTRISEPSGSGWLGSRSSSRLAWTWAATRDPHMAGSQPMISSGLTCWATQEAACVRAAVTEASALPPLAGTLAAVRPSRPVPEEPAAGVLLSRAAVMAPAPNTSAASRRAASTRHRVLLSRRPSHIRSVVASTVPQDGSPAGRLAGGAAACLVAGTAPGRVAGTAAAWVAGTAAAWVAGTVAGPVAGTAPGPVTGASAGRV